MSDPLNTSDAAAESPANVEEAGGKHARSFYIAGLGASAGHRPGGFGTDKDLAESKAAGFLDHFVKPLDLSALDQGIQRAAPAELESETTKTGPLPSLPLPAQRLGQNSANFLEEPFPVAYRFAFCMTLVHDRAAEITEAVSRRPAGRFATGRVPPPIDDGFSPSFIVNGLRKVGAKPLFLRRKFRRRLTPCSLPPSTPRSATPRP